MASSVIAGAAILVAITMAIRTDFRFGVAESGGCAASYIDAVEAVGGDDLVVKSPRQSSGQTVRR
jgi:hypothetical protein